MSEANLEDGRDWMYYMRRGEWEQAWRLSDAALKERAGKPCWHWPRHLQYIWNGSSLQGKRVLVRCYHGLGDTIQFIRYIPLVKSIASEVIVWAQPPLLSLLQTINGIDQLLPLHEGTSEVVYDVDVEIMELPHIFRTTVGTIPLQIPYIHVAPMRLSTNKQVSVGLVWKAGDWDPRRHLQFEELLPLFEASEVQFYILQEKAKEAGWKEGYGVHPGEFSLPNYARVIKGLDLLITVDSMPAHLAGAMGVPVWTLLHAEADWRWMNNRDDSPWYPTMRLFRQQAQGAWGDVIQSVKRSLPQLVENKKKYSNATFVNTKVI